MPIKLFPTLHYGNFTHLNVVFGTKEKSCRLVGIHQNSFSTISLLPESVLRSQSALWLSKDSKWMAFLQLNDSKVSSISYKQLSINTNQAMGELKYAKVCEDPNNI